MSGKNCIIQKLRERFSEPPTQASLFHYIKEKPRSSARAGLDWNLHQHPFGIFKVIWENFLKDMAFSFRSPAFIPSVFCDADGLLADRAQLRTRRVEAGALSVLVHAAIIGLALLLIHKGIDTVQPTDNVTFVKSPMIWPFEGDARSGGGGGGGGKGEQAPPARGRMPDTARFQISAPDPNDPIPLVPAEDLMAAGATVVMPVDIPQDQSLPIGDMTAPPSNSHSSGPGTRGGIGYGDGTGVGPGKGPGYGPGEEGGTGGGKHGGIGPGDGPYPSWTAGLKIPQILLDPKPAYTEDARKARTEGVLLLQAVIRKDGSVDSFKVIRGLGHGLEESAIRTIGAKWRFRPGTLNGVPVDVIANIEVSFRLF